MVDPIVSALTSQPHLLYNIRYNINNTVKILQIRKKNQRLDPLWRNNISSKIFVSLISVKSKQLRNVDPSKFY